ncbi:MAG: bis(5'-nucleosyl)-tetraphosphatase (symmetrical) YqeK [Tenericutes bacterium]|nr:bis(5'-nucleosyl)-tetraphosphatase (symmetrical) YqeK [Mycoplasmatota bacterium]
MINDELINQIEDYLFKKFNEPNKRLKHIYNVKKVACTLGAIYNADIPSVVVASYLHDATKNDSIEENIKLAGNLIYDDTPEACIHAYAAHNLAKTMFKIDDLDILNAIKFHCSGRAEMSLIEKIIYVSDFIEEDRPFVTVELRELAKTNIDKTVYLIMVQTKDYILKNKQEFSSYTEEAILFYKKKAEEFDD